jgi:hemolysin III
LRDENQASCFDAEIIADGIIHVISVLSGIIAATVLVVLAAVYTDATDIVGVSIHVARLLSIQNVICAALSWPARHAIIPRCSTSC